MQRPRPDPGRGAADVALCGRVCYHQGKKQLEVSCHGKNRYHPGYRSGHRLSPQPPVPMRYAIRSDDEHPCMLRQDG